jgi:hypothetical protein
MLHSALMSSASLLAPVFQVPTGLDAIGYWVELHT